MRKEGANQTHHDFRVRRGVVHQALQWLMLHNKYYRAQGVTIDTSTLAQLPQDGTVSNLVSVTEASLSPGTPTTSGTAAEGDSYDDHLPQSFVPVAVPSMTEQEAVQQSVQQRQSSLCSHGALMWPSVGGMPLNEFTTEGYFTCAFPTLFPTGAGDFLGQHSLVLELLLISVVFISTYNPSRMRNNWVSMNPLISLHTSRHSTTSSNSFSTMYATRCEEVLH